MALQFPLEIKSLNTALECIGESREFIVKKKDPFTYINYKRVMSSTFPPLSNDLDEKELYVRRVRRELRGLVFDNTTGDLIARSMHKFFNLNEREESSIQHVQQLIQKHAMKVVVVEKLDGSLANPLLVQSEDQPLVKHLRFRTKMGFDNDHTDTIERILFGREIKSVASFTYDPVTQRHVPEYAPDLSDEGRELLNFCVKWIDDGYTLLFEFFDRAYRVVVDYDESFVSLLAIRHTKYGHYVDYHEMVEEAKKHNVRYAQELDISSVSTNSETMLQDLINFVHKKEYVEGYVIRISNADGSLSEMYKTKTKWYSDIHRVKELIALNNMPEHYVWALVIDNTVDDALPTMHREEHRQRLIRFNDELSQAIEDCADEIEKYLQVARSKATTVDGTVNMKLFAQYVNSDVTKERGATFAQALFKMQKDLTADPDKSIEDMVCSFLKVKVKNSILECQRLLGKPGIKFYTESDTKKTKLEYISKRRQKELDLQKDIEQS